MPVNRHWIVDHFELNNAIQLTVGRFHFYKKIPLVVEMNSCNIFEEQGHTSL